MANKVRYGLEKVHIIPLTEEEGKEPVLGTPKHLPGAVSLSLEVNGESTTFSADNTAYYVADANNGYTGTLEAALIPDWFLIKYLGYKKDDNGVIIEDASAQADYFAMAFEFVGNENSTRHILYKVRASRTAVEGKTVEEDIEVQTESLPITVLPLQYKGKSIVKGKTTDMTADDVYKNWFIEPVMPKVV